MDLGLPWRYSGTKSLYDLYIGEPFRFSSYEGQVKNDLTAV